LAKRKKKRKSKSESTVLKRYVVFIITVVSVFSGLAYHKEISDVFNSLSNSKVKSRKEIINLPNERKQWFHPKPYSIKNFNVFGIDVSRYQGSIDWNAVVNSGIDFAYIKCSEGISLSDSNYEYNHKNAKKAGLLTGVYHFFRPKQSGNQQAEWFLSNYREKLNDLPVMIDVEQLDNVSPTKMRAELYSFIHKIEKHTQKKIVIYSGKNFYTNHLQGYFNDKILWIANYNPYPQIGNLNWMFWQYTEIGRVPGINHKVDINVFNGNLTELYQLTE